MELCRASEAKEPPRVGAVSMELNGAWAAETEDLQG